ncbi:MAG: 1-deoxy-D-xylulose-5-phosphate synthase N-terminal domain-containing protein, partial [Cyanobacteria bacterium P01_D01_bin.2]
MHLSDIKHPNQLHGLSVKQLEAIAQQIREKHLQTVAASGGHLGPGLGVVELTLGLYQTLDLDRDKVIWDVGHQAYPHKLLTGRYGDFASLRQKGGICALAKARACGRYLPGDLGRRPGASGQHATRARLGRPPP